MRTTYVQDRKTGKLVEVERSRTRLHYIRRDIDPFISPIDGSIIGSQTDLRAHNDKHSVIPVAEFGNQIEIAVKERQDKIHGKKAREQRVEAIKHAVEVHRDNEYSTYQNYVDNYK